MKVSRSFVLNTKEEAGSLLSRIIPSLANDLRCIEAGTVTETETSVAFRRGYSFIPFTPNKLASFESGTILIQAYSDRLKVKCIFGLEGLYFQFAFLPISIGLLIYFGGLSKGIALLCAGLIGTFIASIIYNIWDASQWVRHNIERVIK